MRKSIRTYEASEWIENQQDFYIRASKTVRQELGVEASMEGRNIEDATDWIIPQGQLPDGDYAQMLTDMGKRGVIYIVCSYHTVIGWKERSGQWHLMPQRYSLTTTQHQHTLWNAVGRMVSTERVIMDDEVKIGRPGF